MSQPGGKTGVTTHQRVNSPWFLVALATLALMTASSNTVSPILLGAYVDYRGLSERAGGLVIAAEAAGYALAYTLFLWKLHQWNRRLSALISVGIVLAVNALTIFVGDAHVLAAVRCVGGLGMGWADSVQISSIAARARPQRDYPTVAVASLGYSALLLAFAPRILNHYGLAGIMLFMVVIGSMAIPAALYLPVRIPARSDVAALHSGRHSSPVLNAAALRLAFTCLVLYAGHNALWSYQERMGLATGLTPDAVGTFLGLSVLCGAVGAGLAVLTNVRFGFSRPQWASYGVLIAAALLLTHKATALTYVLGAMLVKVGWFYGYPLLQGALAELDRSGRVVVLATLLQVIGATIGPAAAAALVPFGYTYVGWTGIFFYLICIPLSIGVLRTMDKTHARPSSTAPHETLHSDDRY